MCVCVSLGCEYLDERDLDIQLYIHQPIVPTFIESLVDRTCKLDKKSRHFFMQVVICSMFSYLFLLVLLRSSFENVILKKYVIVYGNMETAFLTSCL